MWVLYMFTIAGMGVISCVYNIVLQCGSTLNGYGTTATSRYCHNMTSYVLQWIIIQVLSSNVSFRWAQRVSLGRFRIPKQKVFINAIHSTPQQPTGTIALSGASKLASAYFTLFYRSVHVLYTGIYNRSLCRTRVLIEQTFGVLKKWFRCLHTELITVPHQAVTYITACAVLHNIGIFRGDIILFDLDFIQEDDQSVIQINDLNDGAGIREHTVQTFFPVICYVSCVKKSLYSVNNSFS